jgi:hypothetical protein
MNQLEDLRAKRLALIESLAYAADQITAIDRVGGFCQESTAGEP